VTLSPTRPTTLPAGFATGLARHGDRPALVDEAGTTLTYAELSHRVDAVRQRLGSGRRLVLVAGANTVDTVVTYLAGLTAGHVVLLAGDGADQLHGLVAAYDPDVVATARDGSWSLTHRRQDSVHDLHPDLALLLSTSGSTGSPKLVRLSHANLQSNAEAIVTALDIRPTDRAATTLPLHYCYGLSVLNSHLQQGASLLVTGLSVVAPCFWEAFRRHEATTLAGVPHTFELLERAGFPAMDLPSLRSVTQAGGRMAPERVRGLAALGRERGWRLHVMYGQTEATARMACLPPSLAEEHPASIGIPVPGGSFVLEPTDDLSGPDEGELVYCGPNVMMGYATSPTDLARGHEVDRLRTGDLARRTPEGLYEVVGRRSRFAKVVGLRIDLERVERQLAEDGVQAYCADGGDALVVLSPAPLEARRLARRLAQRYAVPAGAVRVVDRTEPPLLASGKPDYRAIAGLAAGSAPALADDLAPGRSGPEPSSGAAAGAATTQTPPAQTPPTQALVALYAELLDRPDATADSTFTGLGGDSLSYVEVSLRLERILGDLPPAWHLMTVRELAEHPVRPHNEASEGTQWPWRRWRQVETGVALRAVAVLLILANHTHLADVPGGAHTLLALAGFNFARFQLTGADRPSRVRGILRSASRVFVPSAIWIGGLAVLSDDYAWHNPLMLQQVLGDHAQWSDQWHFWFIEVLLYLLVGLAGLLAIPALDRIERRWPFGLALTVVGAGLLTRYAVVVPDAGPYRGATAYVLVWLFALGWAAQRASTTAQRLVVSGAALATIPGFWDSMPGREATVIAGALLLTWVPAVRLPGWAARAAAVVASASLYVYLTHFAVYPHLMAYSSPLAMAACVGVGVAYWKAFTGLTGRLGQRTQRKAETPVSA
jgi:acyl-CoA synthetase (AMP-forming)/AMP-acid ligase II